MAMEKELDGDIDGAIVILEEAIGTIRTTQDNTEINAKLESLRQLKEEMQNPDLAEMTDELMQIVDEWRYYYDMATEEDKEAIFTSYADTFQKYIVLYESVYGTEECTCGQLYIDSASTLNDKDYFDLGTAYDFVIYFRLVTNDEDKAWILRSVQAEKSGVSAFLNGFSVWCEMKYEETKIEGRSRWTLVSRTLQYSDMDGNIYPMKHNNLYINGTQTYDKYGRLISINMEYVDDTECCKKYIYGNRSEQILDQLKINGQEYRVISDISSEPNVCMENLVLYFAKSSFVRPDVSSEAHDWIDLLYVFRDGSVYCANEYYHDYYEKGDCSERYYPQDIDEKWEHIKDWVYLGSISSDDMELILKEVDDIDENAKKADYLYTWEWSQLTGQIWKTEVQWQEPPSGDMSKFEKLQDVIRWGTYLSFCVCKNTSCYELWNTEESMYNSSIVSRLSVDENTLNLIYDVLGSAFYEQWTTISPQVKTSGLQYNTWERTRRIIDLDATENPGSTCIVIE